MDMNRTDQILFPDRLFEVSWEVCNKVGGIHTVIATKAKTVVEKLGDNYVVLGPDLNREQPNPEFEEDGRLMKAFKDLLYDHGIRVRIGRWKVKGEPVAILVDFSSLISSKDEILKFLWETYGVDSISGQWDYIEPLLFGYAAAKVIECHVAQMGNPSERTVAHFHEWMTASGGLYLRKASPFVATVFTTHATILGRTLAGNGEPLYGNLTGFNSEDYARRFNIVSKNSMERASAHNYDAFTTVSDLTARECRYLLGREPDLVTPNGFEDDFVWKGQEAADHRKAARDKLIEVAEATLGHKFQGEPLIVGTSGRYEFHNKGIDVLLDALKVIASEGKTSHEILAYIMVPAGNDGPRHDVLDKLNGKASAGAGSETFRNSTHYLPTDDPIVKNVNGSILQLADSPVKLVFVPSYLNGDDGIFNMPYYDLLVGMDLTVFASYYEPWGYTPLESVAFGIPTITTTLAGFGLWVDDHSESHPGILVLDRTDDNDQEIVRAIADSIRKYAEMTAPESDALSKGATEVSRSALWENLFSYYERAYSGALAASLGRVREDHTASPPERHDSANTAVPSEKPVWKRLMVEKSLPEKLRPLEELSRNLWWSWNSGARDLFEYADGELWPRTGKNPIELLDGLSYQRIKELEKDTEFLQKLAGVYSGFKDYMAAKEEATGPTVAYFSMEYGIHSSLKIYSGGLGILAGDYLKEASDTNFPITAVGLLYRYGYFTQKLSAHGEQEASYEAQNFYKLPISPVRDKDGNWLSATVGFPGRDVTARIWKCEVGRTDLYLLDTDHEHNLPEDRTITHHLYGGDWDNRLKQELILGIGGIRALRKVGVDTQLYHCNEGHAAFIGVERLREYIESKEFSFMEAYDIVRSSSLFTTHTPVPAGHDMFPEGMIRQYMSHYPARLGISWEQFIALGRSNPQLRDSRFSMSVLAAKLSQEINGVSRLHGEVTRHIFADLWPGYFVNELHVGYVTNGVHFPTWCAANMKRLYAEHFPEGFYPGGSDIESWKKIYEMDDRRLWEERIYLKNRLIKNIRQRLGDPRQFMFASPATLVKIGETLRPDVLTIGFARRFATYKRAQLLFTDLKRLDSIVNNPVRPVQFIFAGKAHPNDGPGQDLIRKIVEVSSMPQFAGKIIFLQNYDMQLARKMVQGVDVWLNTPTRPQEASGTSGEKAVMNGVLQFSVLDGWWVEGYRVGAGWMLPQENSYDDPSFQNSLDAEIIYATIEEQIVPRYYKRDKDNIPHNWLDYLKKCIAEIAPNFTTHRMLADYRRKFYDKLAERSRVVIADDYKAIRELARWKTRIWKDWDGIRIEKVEHLDMGREAILVDRAYHIEVTLDLGALSDSDIGVELVMARHDSGSGQTEVIETFPMTVKETLGGRVTYMINATPTQTGSFDVAIRIYAWNPLLAHRMDFPLVKWA